MRGTHVLVEDINWFAGFSSRQLPCLLEVLGLVVLEIEVVGVGIAVAGGLNWAVWAYGLSAEFFVVDEFHLMDVLAWVAVP